MNGRPPKLQHLTQAEVRAKTKELGTLTKAAKFYGCSTSTVKAKIGDFQYRGVSPEDLEDIKKMATTHTKKAIGELLGYSFNQLEWLKRTTDISFEGRKPRSSSKLTHYEINNMDLIVKQYPTARACADDHDVKLSTIWKHVHRCRKIRAGKQATS